MTISSYDNSFMGYKAIGNIHKSSQIKPFTANKRILSKIPYTILESQEPQKTLLYNIWARCHNERNNSFITTIGSTGSGKSYTNIYFGYMTDVDAQGNHLVTPDNICFEPIKFIDMAAEPDHKGKFIMKDEIEMDANSRSSFSALNQIIGKVMSTVRYKRSIIFLNLPTEQQLDIQVLRLRYGNIDCDKVAADGSHSIFNWEYIVSSKRREVNKYNPPVRRTRLFTFAPIQDTRYGSVRSKQEYEHCDLFLPVRRADFRHLLKIYDKNKDEYLKSKFDGFRAELHDISEKNKNKEFLVEDYLMAIDKVPDYFCPGKNNKISLARIQKEFSVTLTYARLIASEYKNTRIDLVDKTAKKKEKSDFLDQLKKKSKKMLEG